MWRGMSNGNEMITSDASRLNQFLAVALWSVAVTATVAYVPLQVPSPIVPLKQFALGTIGALLGIVTLSRLHLRWPIARLAKASYQTAWLACAIGWVAWAMLRTLLASRATWYEAYWGNSDRGSGILTHLGFVGVAIAAMRLAGHIKARQYIWCFAAVLWVVMLYNVCQMYGLDFVRWDVDPKYVATFGNLNQASSFYAAGTIVLGLATWDEWLERPRSEPALLCWGLGSCAALGLCLRTSMAGSRQGLFLVAVVAAVVILCRFRWRIDQDGTGAGRQRWLGLAAAIVAFSLVYTLVYTLRDHGVGDRFRLWSTAIAIWWNQPLVGAGIGQIPWVWYQHATSAELQARQLFRLVDEVHSGPLQQAAELGLPGLVSYAGLLLVPTAVAIKRLQDHSGLSRAIAALWILFVLQDLFSPAAFGLTSWAAIAAGILLQGEGGVEASPRPRHAPAFWRTSIAVAACGMVAALALQRLRTEYPIVRAWNSASGLNAASAGVRRRLVYLSARPDILQAVSLRPFDTAIATAAGLAAARNGDPTTARMIATASLQNEPRNLRLHDLLGQLAFASGNPDSAAAQYARAAQVAPRSAVIALMWDIAAQRSRQPGMQRVAGIHLDSLIASQRLPDSLVASWRSSLIRGTNAAAILYRPYGQ